MRSTFLMSMYCIEWIAWMYESIDRDCISRCDAPLPTKWQTRQAMTPALP